MYDPSDGGEHIEAFRGASGVVLAPVAVAN
jgi:hypothetical protein